MTGMATTQPSRRRGFRDLGTGVKIFTAVGVAALVALAVGLVGLMSLAEASSAANQIYSGNVASVGAIGNVRAAVLEARLDASNQALAQEAATTKTSRDEPGRVGQALDTALARLRETVSTIDGSAASLASASEEISGTARQIAGSAEETSAQALAVSAAASAASTSTSTTMNQLGVSSTEIGNVVSHRVAAIQTDAAGAVTAIEGTRPPG